MRYLLHDVFAEAARSNPSHTAILTEDGSILSYGALNELSNRFASYIARCKPSVRNRPYVGILSPVSPNSIAAALGALKAGAAYVPLDEQSPVERLARIVDNTQLDLIFAGGALLERFRHLFEMDPVKHVVSLDENTEPFSKIESLGSIHACSPAEPPELNQVCDDLAYILHTSGSTGVPKGIMLTHRNARTFVDWMQKEFRLTSGDVVMSRAPFKFDLSVFDIFNTFKAGATLVCFDWERERDPLQRHLDYVRLMQRARATILYTTPSTLLTLVNKGGLEGAGSNLRTVMYAGEPFPTPQLRKFKAKLPNTRVANIYGPTETNIITCQWVDEVPPDDSPIPLGHEVDDTEILVVSDDHSRICGEDEVGELWCRGGTVTLGYLNMPDKTRECLVESPFHKYPARFWRTGDYGRRDRDGVLHYHGRRDHMIKVKGFRIELGEIESAVSAHTDIDEFVVVNVPDEVYGNRLVCYYSVLNGRRLGEEELKVFLQTKIPEYMIPFRLSCLPELPQTSSGKVDRVLLAQRAKESLAG